MTEEGEGDADQLFKTMNPNTILPDDPRLTAYALHEMEPEERTEFEQMLRQDPAAQAQVEEIAAAAADLGRALASEVLPATEPVRLEGRAHDVMPKVRVFPYYWVSGLAAACFAVGFIVWQSRYQAPEYRQYLEVNLSTPAPNAGAGDAPAGTAPSLDAGAAVDAVAVASGEGADEGRRAKPDESMMALQLQPEAPPALRSGTTLAEISAAEFQSFADKRQPLARPAPPSVLAESTIVAASPPAPVRGPAANGGVVPLGPQDLIAPVQLLAGSGAAPTVAVAAAPKEEAISLQAFTVSASPKGSAGAMAGMGVSRSRAARSGAARVSGPAPVLGLVAPDIRSDEPGVLRRPEGFDTEAYDRITDNPFVAVAHQPFSTFAIDVDTASYANVRRFLQEGRRPPRDAVRIEELVNYFPYDYAGPVDREMPFAAAMEVASAPWKPEHRLVRIGLKGREIPAAERPAANLVFLIDVSGSMQPENKLPLVKRSLRLLVEQLRADDRVALAVYAGSAGLVLPSTPAAQKRDILEAIDRLDAGGSTNGAMGIQLAYDVAKANFIPGGVNRLILCTDGDFNVGVTNRGDLTRLIEEKAKSGVFLTVLGFGMGNYKDATLEQLADKGNGNHGYIDSLREAQKLLVEQAGGTLVTIAKDVKIQVDFNPAQVQAYRLIGYENRLLRREDFNNDKIDAGEIGAGHTVTALYEIVPVGVEWKPESTVDESRYQVVGKGTGERGQGARDREQGARLQELLTLKLRYKAPDGIMSRLREYPLRDGGARFEEASMDFKFAASVAAFGMILRDSPYKGAATLGDVTAWAGAGIGRDAGGHRTEFLGLVKVAEPLVR